MYIQQLENNIFVIEMHDFSEETLSRWEQVKAEIYEEARHRGEHLLLLYDLREAGWITAEYVQQSLRYLYPEPHAPRRSIAVLTTPYALGLMEQALSRLPYYVKSTVRIFLTEESAINWLEAQGTLVEA